MNDEAKPPQEPQPIAAPKPQEEPKSPEEPKQAGEPSPAEDPKPAEIVAAPDKSSMAYPIGLIKDPFDEKAFLKAQLEHLDALQKAFNLERYTVLFILDEDDSLGSWHSNRIYKAASRASSARPILLILHSLGGSIEDAYLISKTCKRLSSSSLIVAVPRKAKSAATLLSLGADEIHMGLMSQLGPIDPQIRGFPALGIRNALEVVSELACKYPDASTMLGEYLGAKLDLNILGYFERINESATQYAERLLIGKPLPENQSPATLAYHFVNHYKDHRFVIDFDEATTLLGDQIVKRETSEYMFANAVFESFDLARLVLGFVANKDADLVGGIGDTRVFDKKKQA